MAKLLQTLVFLLLSTAALLASPARSQDESTSFAYDFYTFGNHPTTLTYQGDAFFPRCCSTFLRLTRTDDNGNAWSNSVGRVLHTDAVLFKEAGAQADFETTINFLITPQEGVSPADGLAFFIAPVGSTIPILSSGGNLGIFLGQEGTAANLFAVEFDVFDNEWDPSPRHIGIDLGSRVSSNSTQIGTALVGQVVNARVVYVSATKVITVRVTTGGETYDLSYEYDLGELLTDRVQVGLTASTGGSVAVHDIVSWYFSSTLVHTATGNDAARIQQVV